MLDKLKNKIDTYSLLRVFCAILIAYTCTIIIIFTFSKVPFTAMYKFFLGPFTSKRNFFNVVETAIPLLFAGLALNVIQKGGLTNLIADGALYMGAVIASVAAISLSLPKGIHAAVAIAMASLVGGLITLIPAIIKKFTGAWEMVVAIMLNTVFFYVGQYIINSKYLDEVAGYASYKFAKTSKLGHLISGTQMHYGFIIVIIVFILVYILMEKTLFGYDLKIVGVNMRYAKNAGINVFKVVMLSQFIGGCIAGMGGAVEVLGIYDRFLWGNQVSFVWDAILINILAGEKTANIPLTAFFFSFIRVGAGIMSRGTDLDQEIVAIIQAIIIFLVSAERFMYTYKIKREQKAALMEKDRILTQQQTEVL